MQVAVAVVFLVSSSVAVGQQQPMAAWGVHSIATAGRATYEGDKLRAILVYDETGRPQITIESIHVDMSYPSPNRVDWSDRVDLTGDRSSFCPIAETYCAAVEALEWRDDVLVYELVSPSATLRCRVDAIRSRSPMTTCEPAGRIVHVVLVWLKEPGNSRHRAQIIEATRRFSEIPGVDEIAVGEPLPSERATVDDSFDVGLYMTFPSKQALAGYLAHPQHQTAERTLLRPLVRKALVYDFDDGGT